MEKDNIIGFFNAETNIYTKAYGISNYGQTQGKIYKNPVAFAAKSKEVCYIPELSEKQYAYFDFLEIAKGKQSIATYLFETVDWQSPESLYDELVKSGEV